MAHEDELFQLIRGLSRKNDVLFDVEEQYDRQSKLIIELVFYIKQIAQDPLYLCYFLKSMNITFIITQIYCFIKDNVYCLKIDT